VYRRNPVERRKRVKFTATEVVKKPTEVGFRTTDGKEVEFRARKPVKVRKRVDFLAKKD
jgi:hypothetical protein